jgi:histone deacetylase 1/2
LNEKIAIKDLGELHYFLGIKVNRSSNGLLLTQEKSASDLLRKLGMTKCKSAPMPLSTTDPLSLVLGEPLGPEDSTKYRSIIGGLQYLTFTRLDLAFSVNKVCPFFHASTTAHLTTVKRIMLCQFLHAPTTAHLTIVKRIMRYVKDTIGIGITI